VASVELSRITKAFGDTCVLKDINLSVKNGEFLTLVGPSGCGKSTLIRIVAGLEAQDEGAVAIDDAPVDHLRPHERRVAMVFQSYALYPHLTVRENIALPLMMSRLRLWERIPLLRFFSTRRRTVMRDVNREVEAIASQLHLENLLARRPAQLSGGQRQRVALGRAMVRRPDVFLMDEPLSNLDAKLRVHMRSELAELHERLGATFIYVTHDQVEAMTMSDRIAMMDSGRILQIGIPSELYERPANVKVASFIGSPAINLLPARVAEGGEAELFGQRLPFTVNLSAGSPITVGIRPEAVALAGPDASPSSSCVIPAVLLRKENLGPEFMLHLEVGGADRLPVVARVPAGPDLPPLRSDLMLVFRSSACHLFDRKGDRIEAKAADINERVARSLMSAESTGIPA
jgi:multiple sugar transport system ATP-binding protein